MTVKVGSCLLRDILYKRKMTIQELANHLGVSRQQVSKWVNGRKKMSLETAVNVSIVLNVNILDLYEWIEVGA